MLLLSMDQLSRRPIRFGLDCIDLHSEKVRFPLEQRNPKAFVS